MHANRMSSLFPMGAHLRRYAVLRPCRLHSLSRRRNRLLCHCFHGFPTSHYEAEPF